MPEDLKVALGLDASSFLAGIQGVQQSLGGLKGSLASIGLVAAGAFAFNSAEDFDKSLRQIESNARSMTGTAAQLSDAILGVSSTSLQGAFSQNAVAEALAGVVNEAASAEAALGLVEAAGRLASVTGADLADTSQNVANVLSTYGLSTDQAARVTQTLYEASRQTGTGIDELSGALKTAAPLARALDLSFEQTAAIAGVLKDSGVESANSLLAAWTKTGGSGGLPGLMAAINKAIEEGAARGLTAGEALAQAFGKGSIAALALVQNAGTLETTLAAVTTPTDSLNAAFGTSVTAATSASSQFKNLTTEVGQALLPAVNGVLELFNGLIGVLSEMGILDEVAIGVTALAGAFVLWKVATLAQAVAMGILNIAMSPITLIVLGIAAAVAAVIIVWKNWDKITAFLARSFEWVKEKFQKFWFLLGPVGFAIKGIIEVWKHWDDIVGFFSGTIDKARELIHDLLVTVGGIGKAIIDGIVNGLQGGVDAVVDAAKNVGEKIKAGFKKIFGIGSPSTVFADFGGDMMDGLSIGLIEGAANASDEIDSAFDSINAAAEEAGAESADKFAGIGSAIAARFTDSIGGIKDFFESGSASLTGQIGDRVNVSSLSDLQKRLRLQQHFEGSANLLNVQTTTGGNLFDSLMKWFEALDPQRQRLLSLQKDVTLNPNTERDLRDFLTANPSLRQFLDPDFASKFGFAHGFEGIVRGPATISVAEHGAEFVQAVPMARRNALGGESRTILGPINVYANSREGGLAAADALTSELRRRGVFG